MLLDNFHIQKDDDILGNKLELNILHEKNRKIYIIYGKIGCGKSRIIEYILNTCFKLEFNAYSKKSLKYIKDEVENFIKFNTFDKQKVILFDDFEVFIQEGVGAGSIIDTLKQVNIPVYIVVHEIHLNKMKKICTKGNFEYIHIKSPSKDEYIAFFTKFCKSQSLKITKTKIKSIVSSNYPDMRRIAFSIDGMNLGKIDIFSNNYVETFDRLRSNTLSFSEKLLFAESDIFTQLSVFHENYPNLVDKQKIHTISDSISIGDIYHTYSYINQEWELMYVSILCGIIYPSQYFRYNKKPTYASIISKISNLKTKEKNKTELLLSKGIDSYEQLKCLWLLEKTGQKEKNKMNVLFKLS